MTGLRFSGGLFVIRCLGVGRQKTKDAKLTPQLNDTERLAL